MNAIDRTRPQKLYCQILEILQRHIERGEWRVGSRIPTEEQLCSQYDVSRATVRLAVEELVSLGYLKRFQGKGTYVRRRNPENSLATLVHLGDGDICHNFSCITRVLESRSLEPSGCVRDHLNLSDGDYCFYVLRLTISDCSPVRLQELYIPYSLIPGVPDDGTSAELPAHALLEQCGGIKVQRIQEMTDVFAASDRHASLLELASPAAVLRARQVYFAPGDMAVGFSESLYRTDANPRMLAFERLRI
jgi:DNA-binding GntR family transcriptional regulator